MLTELRESVLQHRTRVYEEYEVGASKANILLIFDTLYELLAWAIHSDNTRHVDASTSPMTNAEHKAALAAVDRALAEEHAGQPTVCPDNDREKGDTP